MCKRPSFFNALLECIGQSIRIGVLVSTFLTLIVIVLDNFTQAASLQRPRIVETGVKFYPQQLKSSDLPCKSEGRYQASPCLHTDTYTDIAGMKARVKIKLPSTDPADK